MSLSSALDTGASGLDSSSLDLDVIGNNIANADTVGFKEGRADFEEAMSQSLIGGGGQLGLGSNLQTVQEILSQGSLTTTGNATDLALQGNGFFMAQGTQNGVTGSFYTRDGQFTIDQQGNLVTEGGLDVQGFQANAAGQLTGAMGNLQVGDATSPPNPTANVTVKANLNSASVTPTAPWNVAQASATSNFSTSTTVYDSLGNSYQVQLYFRQDSSGNWEWHAVTDGGGLTGGTAGTPTEIANGTLTFNTSGELTAETQASNFNPLGAVNPQPLNFNFGDPTGTGGTGLAGITQFAGTSAASFVNQDGYATGTLSSISVDPTGLISGSFSNGQSLTLGQVAVASFAAPDQLQQVGGNMFTQTATSGQPAVGAASSGGRGSIVEGALEQSNVDVADQLVDMISTQKDYQSNAQVVTTADQMLQTLITSVQNG